MRTDLPNIDFHDWLVLDALSDDYESVEQIVQLVRPDWFPASSLEVIERLECLYTAGHVILILGATFERAELVREVEHSSASRFWFGRTPSGDVLWEQHATTFGHA